MIESYAFGEMVVNGKKYTSDIIIFPDRIKSSWWRITGHKLSLQDLKDVIEEKPEILVIGTGSTGLMKVDQEVLNYFHEKSVTLIIEKTGTAVLKFNKSAPEKKTVGAFHLTC